MSATTGPVLAIGAITMINQNVLHDRPVNWKVPVATGIGAGMFAIVERAQPKAAEMVVWAAMITILFSRINGVPSPTETFLDWWTKGEQPAGGSAFRKVQR